LLLVVLLGVSDPLTAEEAAVTLVSAGGNIPLATFEQFERHGRIQCEKIGTNYSFGHL